MAKRRAGRPAASTPARVGRGLDPWRLGILAAVVIGIVVVVAAVLTSPSAATNYTCAQLLQPGANQDDGEVTPDQGRGHVATGARIDYLFCPPASGQHYSGNGVGPIRAGFYGPDSDVGPGGWVHNLEHGYVVALYRCEDGVCPSEEELAQLRQFVNNGPSTASASRCGIRSKVLAARFDDMATPFALLTWNRALLLDSFDVEEALDFATRWIEKGAPEATSC